MNKNMKYIFGLLFSTMIFISACEENEFPYGNFNPATDIAAQTVLLSKPNITVSVDPRLETTKVVIGVQLWGSLSDEDIVIPFTIDSATMQSDWYTVSGGGFVIPAGKNTGSLEMTIDNTVFPGGYFALYYHLGDVTGVEVNEKAKNGVIDAFSPGELAPFMGNYVAAAASYYNPGAWDEEWNCTIVLNRADPNSIDIYGIGGKNTGKYLTATIDLVAGTISAVDNQNIGDCYGYGDIIAVGDPQMVGTVDETTGTIVINDIWLLMTGEYAGYDWDIFDATFTKATKKSSTVKVPVNKKPNLIK